MPRGPIPKRQIDVVWAIVHEGFGARPFLREQRELPASAASVSRQCQRPRALVSAATHRPPRPPASDDRVGAALSLGRATGQPRQEAGSSSGYIGLGIRSHGRLTMSDWVGPVVFTRITRDVIGA